MSGIPNNTNLTNQINQMSGIPNNQINQMSGNPITTTPVQQSKKTSSMLLFGGFVFLLVVVGGAAYYYYNQMTITESIQPKQKIENSDNVQYSVPVKKKKLKTAKKTKLYETEDVELNPVFSAHVTNFLDMDAIKAKEIIENQYSYKINEVVILPLHSMVTKDYREDRVRLYVNYKNLVKKIEAPGLPDIEGRSLPSNLDVIEEDYYSTESTNEVVDEFVETDVVSQNIVVYETEVEPIEEVVFEPEEEVVLEPEEEVIETENVSQNIVVYETVVEPIEEVVFEPEEIEPDEEVIETENVSQNIVVYETEVEPIEEVVFESTVIEPEEEVIETDVVSQNIDVYETESESDEEEVVFEPEEEVIETDAVSHNIAVYETEVEPDVQVVFEPTVIEPEEEVIETDVVSQNIAVYETEVEPDVQVVYESTVIEPEEEVIETDVVSQNVAIYETEVEPVVQVVAPQSSTVIISEEPPSDNQCAANFGSTTACCGQEGDVSSAYICPGTKPYCRGYIRNQKWGNCYKAVGLFLTLPSGHHIKEPYATEIKGNYIAQPVNSSDTLESLGITDYTLPTNTNIKFVNENGYRLHHASGGHWFIRHPITNDAIIRYHTSFGPFTSGTFQYTDDNSNYHNTSSYKNMQGPIFQTIQELSQQECANRGGDVQTYNKCPETGIIYCCGLCHGIATCPSNEGLLTCACTEESTGENSDLVENVLTPEEEVNLVENVLTPEEEVINSGEVYKVYCEEWGGPVDCKNGQVTGNLTVCNSDCSNPSMQCPYENRWGPKC